MASKLLLLVFISYLTLMTEAVREDGFSGAEQFIGENVFSGDELALRKAIQVKGPATFILRKNIVLTADLPTLGSGKTLTVLSSKKPGFPFTIDGANKYAFFASAFNKFCNLTLKSLVLTRSTLAVSVSGNYKNKFSTLSINSVKFIDNAAAIELDYNANAKIVKSTFRGHTQSAIMVGVGNSGTVSLSKCTFEDNKGSESGNSDGIGSAGGAILFKANFGILEADNCVFNRNSADLGGAVWASGSSFFTDCSLYNNKALKGGAAFSYGAMSFTRTTFKKNVADTTGGAVFVLSYVYFNAVDFFENTAVAKPGGAFALTSGTSATFCKVIFVKNNGAGKYSNGYVFPGETVAVDALVATIYGTQGPLRKVTVAPGTRIETIQQETCTYSYQQI